jgi:hypothetical protein
MLSPLALKRRHRAQAWVRPYAIRHGIRTRLQDFRNACLECREIEVPRNNMNPTDSSPSNRNLRDMPAGVLEQAKKDLRRFHQGATSVERELYRDAYRWVTSDDCAWPFSFRNVCELLGFTPEELRRELIGDHSLGMLRYRMRRCGRMVSRLQISFSQLFAAERNRGARYAC